MSYPHGLLIWLACVIAFAGGFAVGRLVARARMKRRQP